MIEINLLPEEQRVKARKPVAPVGPGFDPTYLVYAAPAAIAVLLLVHIFLGFSLFIQQSRLSVLNKDWAGLEGERRNLTSYKSEFEATSQDAQIIDELTNKSVRWSEKLNLLSLELPPGIWFNKISFSRKSLEIDASVFSIENNNVDVVNKYLSNLKKNKEFFKDFSSLETGNMITDKIGSYDVMDFTITGTLKGK